MNKEENRAFIKKTESLVSPEDVTPISFLGDFNQLLPVKTQHKIMEKGSKSIPYMGFIVEPYCSFLAYEIKDKEAATTLLPPGYELADSALFSEEKKVPLIVFCAFSVRTSAFIGTRLESYIIARHKETGLLSWIIAGYETNTNSHDPKNGFCGYTCDTSVFTTTPYGELLVDFKGKKKKGQTGDRIFSLQMDLNQAITKDLDNELWVEGNLSVDYGGELQDPSSRPFSLIFDPVLMKQALQIPLDRVTLKGNSFFNPIINGASPLSVAVFPFSQHFIIRQDIQRGEMKEEKDLLPQIKEFMSRSGFKTMKGQDIKKPLYQGIILSTLFNLALITFLLIKAFA